MQLNMIKQQQDEARAMVMSDLRTLLTHKNFFDQCSDRKAEVEKMMFQQEIYIILKQNSQNG